MSRDNRRRHLALGALLVAGGFVLATQYSDRFDGADSRPAPAQQAERAEIQERPRLALPDVAPGSADAVEETPRIDVPELRPVPPPVPGSYRAGIDVPERPRLELVVAGPTVTDLEEDLLIDVPALRSLEAGTAPRGSGGSSAESALADGSTGCPAVRPVSGRGGEAGPAHRWYSI